MAKKKATVKGNRRRHDRDGCAGRFVPTSLHRRLPRALRSRVEEALRNPGPGLATYKEVYEHFDLAEYDIYKTSFERYGRKVRVAAGLVGDRRPARPLSAEAEADPEARLLALIARDVDDVRGKLAAISEAIAAACCWPDGQPEAP